MASNQPKLRIEITLDNCADGADQRKTAEELRGFFAEVSSRTHQKWDVVLVDTAQIFHEKTHHLNPRNLPQDKNRWSKNLSKLVQQMDKGRYEVLPAGEIEQRYYDALRPLAFEVAQAENPQFLERHGITSPEDLHAGHLQTLYTQHVASMPKDSPHRDRESFTNYAAVRADCGEQAMAHYLKHREGSPQAENTLNIFVSVDRGALDLVAAIGKEKEGRHVMVSPVHPRNFPDLAASLAKATKNQYPECADIAYGKSGTRFSEAVESSRLHNLVQR